MCVCSLRYPACNGHAPYCHLWPVWLYSIFSTFSHKGKIFKKKKTHGTQNVCFDFLYNFCLNNFSFEVELSEIWSRLQTKRISSTWSDSKQGVLRSSSEAFEGNRTPEGASVVDEPDLGVAPRQCTSSLVVPRAQFSGEKWNDHCTPATLLYKFGSSGLFLLFPKLKSTLKGRRFDTFDEIQKNSTKELFAIPKEAFQSWQKRWERCVASEGK